MFDMENGRVLDFKGEKRVSYAEFSPGSNNFTLCTRISGAPQCFIEPAMVIYQNNLRIYPIRGVAPQPGICYRSQPRGWMDQQLFAEYFKEPKAISALPDNRRRKLFVDGCTSHHMSPALLSALDDINTELLYLPVNCTHLVQLLDQLILKQMKAMFRKKRNQKLVQLIHINDCASTGRVRNPGKLSRNVSKSLTIERMGLS